MTPGFRTPPLRQAGNPAGIGEHAGFRRHRNGTTEGTMNGIRRSTLFCLAALTVLIAGGCYTSSTVEVKDKIVGVRSGRFVVVDGKLGADYPYPYDRVWKAAEKTLAELKATEVVPDRGIASGSLQGRVDGDRVMILIDYISRDRTSVSVLVGLVGDTLGTRLIHERIADNLKKTSP
jgi:hypothetical protein